MSTAETACATRLYGWPPSQSKFRESCVEAEALRRGRALSPEYWTAGFRRVVEAS